MEKESLSQIARASQNFNDGMEKLSESPENYADFLNFAGRLFKQPASVIISLYGHGDVNSMLIANASVWEKLGNPIKSGAEPIMVMNNLMAERVYTFDETVQNFKPSQWVLSKDNAMYIIDDYNTKNGTHWKNFGGVLSRIAQKYAKEYLKNIASEFGVKREEYAKFSESFGSIVTRISSARCEVNGKYKNTVPFDGYAFDFEKNSNAKLIFMMYAMSCARLTLQEIETQINHYTALESERSKENGKITTGQNNNTRGHGKHDGFSGQVRSGMGKVHGGELPGGTRNDGGHGTTQSSSRESGRGRTGTPVQTGGTVRGEASTSDRVRGNVGR